MTYVHSIVWGWTGFAVGHHTDTMESSDFNAGQPTHRDRCLPLLEITKHLKSTLVLTCAEKKVVDDQTAETCAWSNDEVCDDSELFVNLVAFR